MKYTLIVLNLLMSSILIGQSQCADDLSTPDLPPWEYADWAFPWKIETDVDDVQVDGHAYLKLRCGAANDSLRKPFIFVEGIDFNTDFTALRCGDFGWEEFSSGNTPGYEMLYNLPGLLDSLRIRGYDIILLDFRDGARRVEENSALLQELIRKVNSHKLGKEPLVIAGASMGGQISRHAIRSMEIRGENHCARLWISLDSPHNGANIPIGLQEALWFLAHPLLSSAPTAQEKLTSTLLRPAARQFLKIQMPWVSSIHESYQQMMDSLGYPRKLRTIGLANGAMDGTPVNLIPGEPLFNYVVNDPITDVVLARLVPHALPGNAEGEIFQGDLPFLFQPLFPPFPCPQIPLAAVEDQVPAPSVPWNLDLVSGGLRPSILEMVEEINANLEEGLCDPDLIEEYSVNHSFIPTGSALGLHDSLLGIPLLPILENHRELIPFDYIHGPQNQNEMHSEISDLTLKIILHQILYGENELGPVLDLSSPNSGVYNYKDSARHILYDLTIGAGGLLRVNADLPAHFGQAEPDFPGISPPESHFGLRSNPCGSEVVILENGQMRLGDNSVGNTASWYLGTGSSLRLEEGSKLTLEAGSTVTFGSGSRLEMNGGIIEAMQGAIIRFEENSLFEYKGGHLQMSGAEGYFEMGGKLSVGPGATFTIDQIGDATCPLIWTSTAGAVMGDATSVFRLKALHQEDLVLKLKAGALMKFFPDFHVFQIKRGRVEMGAQSSVQSACPFEAFRVHMVDESGESYGFHTEDQSLLQESVFDNLRFEAWLQDGMLKIWDCSFSGHKGEVVVRNRGFDIRDSDFHCKGVTSEDLSILSRISHCTFTNSGIYADFECVVDQSPVKLMVQDCYFGHCDVALFKEGGELILRCNTFDTNDLAIHAGEQTLLNMSADESAGFNDFLQNGEAIFFDASPPPMLSHGYNRFHQEYHEMLFLGTLTTLNCDDDCTQILDCSHNTWSEDYENGDFGLGGPFPDPIKMDVWVVDSDALCLPDPVLSAGCPAAVIDSTPVDATDCQDSDPKLWFDKSVEAARESKEIPIAVNGQILSFQSDQTTGIEIFTAAGACIKRQKMTGSDHLKIYGLSPGVYLIRFRQEENSWTQKVVIPN